MALRVLDPTGEVERRSLERPAPLAELAGTRVALLDNSKANADLLLRELRTHLVEQVGVAIGPSARKGYASIPAPDDVVDRLAAASDAVLVGTAD